MEVAAGILTALGGLNSHAAVVARGWGIPAVVGAKDIQVGATGISVGDRTFPCGSVITIDGSTGEVFAGEVEGSSDVAPEAATLLAWAQELGIEIGEDDGGPTTEPAAPATAPTGAADPAGLTAADVLRGLLVKGLVPADGLAVTISAPAEEIKPLLDDLVKKELVELAAGAFRLTGAGKLQALSTFENDRERAGGEAYCVSALDGFLALDGRMKDTVTAWQLRTDGPEQTFNDHSDAAYDAAVLERLAALHADAVVWITPVAERLGRLIGYRVRLERAIALALAGDQRFVASPRVDSYHSVWFELHEDLIRLSGRRRSDEAAAGRA
jgi:pyruvate,orthophosphate dikinase